MSKLEMDPRKYGAVAAINSMYEQLMQIWIGIDMKLANLLDYDLPEDHPLRSNLEELRDINGRTSEILEKYQQAAETGDFGFSEFHSGAGPCLDIHPHALHPLVSKQEDQPLP